MAIQRLIGSQGARHVSPIRCTRSSRGAAGTIHARYTTITFLACDDSGRATESKVVVDEGWEAF
jgi:hypothetical protein